MKVLIRFDDICPTMDWEQWERAEKVFKKYNIKPLIGVIPDCEDPDLLITPPRENFWEWLKSKKEEGYEIAMHGYKHLYDNRCRGVINKGLNTEFAGHPYEEQLDKISKGKAILESHGIKTDIFFAPSHSYDDNTLKALAACGFKYNDDGKSTKPIRRYGVRCIPCRAGGAFSLIPQSYRTFVFHAHEWARPDKARGYGDLVSIAEKYSTYICDFKSYTDRIDGNYLLQSVDEKFFLFWDRSIYPKLLRVLKKIK